MRWRCACIDVDETLYNFSTPLYESFVNDGIEIGPPQAWNCWEYISPNTMPWDIASKHFDKIHSQQRKFEPYSGAREFLMWAINNYYVVIASERDPAYKGELVSWLKENNLLFDEVWVGHGKTEMFNKSIFGLVVDDSPKTLNVAAGMGIEAKGLIKPWNKECNANPLIKLYPTLEDIWKK